MSRGRCKIFFNVFIPENVEIIIGVEEFFARMLNTHILYFSYGKNMVSSLLKCDCVLTQLDNNFKLEI